MYGLYILCLLQDPQLLPPLILLTLEIMLNLRACLISTVQFFDYTNFRDSFFLFLLGKLSVMSLVTLSFQVAFRADAVACKRSCT